MGLSLLICEMGLNPTPASQLLYAVEIPVCRCLPVIILWDNAGR